MNPSQVRGYMSSHWDTKAIIWLQIPKSIRASLRIVHQAIEAAGDDSIRIPQVVESESSIGLKSIDLLKRELGLV